MRGQDYRPEWGLNGQPRQLVGHVEGLAPPVAMTREHYVGQRDGLKVVDPRLCNRMWPSITVKERNGDDVVGQLPGSVRRACEHERAVALRELRRQPRLHLPWSVVGRLLDILADDVRVAGVDSLTARAFSSGSYFFGMTPSSLTQKEAASNP